MRENQLDKYDFIGELQKYVRAYKNIKIQSEQTEALFSDT